MSKRQSQNPSTYKSGDITYKEGDVVTCPDKAKLGDGNPKTGTIIWRHHDDVAILDLNGNLHVAKIFEIYPEQN